MISSYQLEQQKMQGELEEFYVNPKKHVIDHFKPSGKIEVGNLTSRPACARAVVMGSLHA